MLRHRAAVLLLVLLSLVMTSLGVVTAESASAASCDGKPANAPEPNGRPPTNAAIRQGSYFSYPNGSYAQRMAIHDRVLSTINSTWGYHDSTAVYANWKAPDNTNCGTYIARWNSQHGTIRMATWSFNDAAMFKALARAVQRGVVVQVVAASGVNAEKGYRPWKDTYSYLNSKWAHYYNRANYARQCRGACRGYGGTPHSKYFLFTDVGYRSATPNVVGIKKIAMQSSMNLTTFAYNGQWNSAVALYSPHVYDRYLNIFAQASNQWKHGYEQTTEDLIVNTFYPGGALNTARDPVLAALSKVRCVGAQGGGVNGRTRVRVIQYAIFDNRGIAIAKKLRYLWNAGCNVAVIYSVSSRNVLSIMRSRSGRGPIPMKQSVIKNRAGDVVKYNHSKWLAISGWWGGYRSAWMVQSGSANWSDFAYGCDEQMQEMRGFTLTAPFVRTFDATWRQKTSRPPNLRDAPPDTARLGARTASSSTFGYGIYKYMDTD